MEHPFIKPKELSKKSIEELQEAISSLLQKLSFAYRTGNRPLIDQLQMALESYRNQQRKKTDELFDKQNLKNKINVSSGNESITTPMVTEKPKGLGPV